MPPIAVAISANGVDAEQGVVEVDQQLPHGRPARPGQRPQEVRRDPVEQPLGSLPISHGPNLFKTKGDHIFKVIVSGRLLSGIGFDDESKPSPPLMPRVVAKLNARVRAIWTLLRWQKGISNAELRALSGLESVQASRTLAALAEKFPGAIEIDRSEKRWQLSDLKVARELGGGLDEYLAMVMGANLEKGWLHDARPAFINPDEVSIALVRQACLQKMGIDVRYVSLTSGETKRTLFPHALVRTAARWQVRA